MCLSASLLWLIVNNTNNYLLSMAYSRVKTISVYLINLIPYCNQRSGITLNKVIAHIAKI